MKKETKDQDWERFSLKFKRRSVQMHKFPKIYPYGLDIHKHIINYTFQNHLPPLLFDTSALHSIPQRDGPPQPYDIMMESIEK